MSYKIEEDPLEEIFQDIDTEIMTKKLMEATDRNLKCELRNELKIRYWSHIWTEVKRYKNSCEKFYGLRGLPIKPRLKMYSC